MYGKIKWGSKKSVFETRKWTYREVLIAMHCDEIGKLAAELSQSAPGLSDYLASYHTACHHVDANLTDD
jgi:hypothetical protein